MPTTRPRHIITETPEIEAALNAAAARYPGDSRADLVRRLVVRGADALAADLGRRRAVLERVAGRYGNLYGPGYLDDLREDWS